MYFRKTAQNDLQVKPAPKPRVRSLGWVPLWSSILWTPDQPEVGSRQTQQPGFRGFHGIRPGIKAEDSSRTDRDHSRFSLLLTGTASLSEVPDPTAITKSNSPVPPS